jgi:serine O-acetyltransferase
MKISDPRAVLELKGCERCAVGETSKRICEVVGQLLPLYRQDDTDAPDSSGGTLPNKKEVIEALQLLEAVLFPGRMSAEAVENGMLEPFIEERLSRGFRLLVPEIARALPLRWTGEYAQVTGRQRDLDDVRAAAEYLTLEFFRRLPRVRQLLIQDVAAAYNGDPAALSYAEVIVAYPGLQAITSHRIAHELYRLDVPVVPRLMSEYTHSVTGIDIHPGATIGERFFIDHGTGVVLGETTEIGNNVKIYQGVTLGAKSFPLDANGHPIKHIKRHPTIEDDVVIYANATILGGDTVIGRGAVIGGNVFLTQSVPPGAQVVNRGVGIEIHESQGPG